MKKLLLAAASAMLFATASAPVTAQVTMTKDRILYYTADWTGERFADGRPHLPDSILERAKKMSMEDIWDELRQKGFTNQYEGGDWHMLHTDKPMAGRAMTTQYMPMRPDVAAAARKEGQGMGLTNLSNNGWPISMLQNGDVWVADGYGKIVEGTLIGSNLGAAIAAKTRTGFVFDAGIRDEAENSQFPDFNGWYRGQDPSAWSQMQLMSINAPVRIGRATVLPGDLVIANKQGVVFVPAQLADEIISKAEFTQLKNVYNFEMNKTGKNGTTFEGGWDAAKYQAFSAWIKKNPKLLTMSQSMFDQLLADAQNPAPPRPR